MAPDIIELLKASA